MHSGRILKHTYIQEHHQQITATTITVKHQRKGHTYINTQSTIQTHAIVVLEIG